MDIPCTDDWLFRPQYGRMVAMASSVQTKSLSLAALDSATVPDLRELYAGIYEHQAPQWASQAFLKGNIAWAIQAHEQGKNPASLREALRNSLNRHSGHTPIRYSPGTRLVREWQGDVYEVTILPKGYLWQGRIYHSLSGIAKEITGAKWSGPRFFGLKAPTP